MSGYKDTTAYVHTSPIYDADFGSGYRVSIYRVVDTDKLAYILYAAEDGVGLGNHRLARRRKQILDYLAANGVEKCKADLTYVADLVGNQLTVPDCVITYVIRSIYVPSSLLPKAAGVA